jgi:hypothetical protein
MDIRVPILVIIVVILVGQLTGWFRGSPKEGGGQTETGVIEWNLPTDMSLLIGEFNFSKCLEYSETIKDEMEGNKFSADCYSYRAIKVRESTLCEEVGNQFNNYDAEQSFLIIDTENKCFFDFAVYHANPEICNNIGLDYMYLSQECIAVAYRNITLCNDTFDTFKIECEAILAKDKDVCNDIEDETTRGECYTEVDRWDILI